MRPRPLGPNWQLFQDSPFIILRDLVNADWGSEQCAHSASPTLFHHLFIRDLSDKCPASPYLLARIMTSPSLDLPMEPWFRILPFVPIGPARTPLWDSDKREPSVIHSVNIEIRRRVRSTTRVITLIDAGPNAANIGLTYFLKLPKLELVRSAHRALPLSTPNVIAFRHQHICEGVVRYVLCTSDFRDFVSRANDWRSAWRSVESLQEVIVIYDREGAVRPGVVVGDLDPDTNHSNVKVEPSAQHQSPVGATGVEAWKTVFGTGPEKEWGIHETIRERNGRLRVTAVGFNSRRWGAGATAAADAYTFPDMEWCYNYTLLRRMRHSEYRDTMSESQYLLETAV